MLIAFILDARALFRFRVPKPKEHGTGLHGDYRLSGLMFVGTVLLMMVHQPFVRFITGSPASDFDYLGWYNVGLHMLVISGLTFLVLLMFALVVFFFPNKEGVQRDPESSNIFFLPFAGSEAR